MPDSVPHIYKADSNVDGNGAFSDSALAAHHKEPLLYPAKGFFDVSFQFLPLGISVSRTSSFISPPFHLLNIQAPTFFFALLQLPERVEALVVLRNHTNRTILKQLLQMLQSFVSMY